MSDLLKLKSDLREIEGAIDEALDGIRDWLGRAIGRTDELDCGGQWADMVKMRVALEEMRRQIPAITPEPIKQAIKVEEGWQDELRDQWDARSY